MALHKIALALGAACLTGLLAQVRVPLPWTPVPITGQTLGAVLAGVVLGTGWGGLSQLLYVSLGAAGVPWFSGARGGMAIVAGPTGGYLFGFILAALFLGYVTDRYPGAVRFRSLLGLMCVASFVLIYVPGLLQLSIWMRMTGGAWPDLPRLLTAGAAPFLAGDAVKIVVAAGLAYAVTPRIRTGF